MIAYHIAFDLYTFGILDFNLNSRWMEVLANCTAGAFFSLVGISLFISYNRSRNEAGDNHDLWRKYLVRGVKLFLLGAVITAVTFSMFPDLVVVFGALHFIGVSVFLGFLVLAMTDRFRLVLRLLLYGIVTLLFFSGSVFFEKFQVEFPYLIPLGIPPVGFQSLDYFPLFPWFGLVSGGLIVGELLYPGGVRRFERVKFGNRGLEFLGRNALVIYFLHQPIIFLAITLTLIVTGKGTSGIL
jgi:uncharacterized membrane protein